MYANFTAHKIQKEAVPIFMDDIQIIQDERKFNTITIKKLIKSFPFSSAIIFFKSYS